MTNMLQSEDRKKFMVVAGTFVDTPHLNDLRIRFRCCVGIDLLQNGKIVFIKEDSDNFNQPIYDAIEYDANLQLRDIDVIHSSDNSNGCKYYFPGFIDTHCHASQYPNAGIFGNTTLLDWLNKYTFPMEKSLDDLSIAIDVYTKTIKKTLSHGTTCIAYYATINYKTSILLAELCHQFGQRSFVGKVCMDSNSPHDYIETTDNSIKDLNKFLQYLQTYLLKDDKINPIITPRFAPSCSPKLMQKLGEIAEKKNLHIQTHLSENLNEIEWVNKIYPEFQSYTHVYDHFKLLTNKTILAHCVHLSDDEADLIKTRGCGVSHCPISNSAITSGECKVRWLLDKKINVSLGTDLSGGFSASILNTARQALLVSRHVAMKFNHQIDSGSDSTAVDLKNHYKLSTVEVLHLATMGGAKCLKMDHKIGSFDVGKEFDCQMIDLDLESESESESPIDIFQWQYSSRKMSDREIFRNLIDKWVFNGDDRNTRKVWVQGVLVKDIHDT